MLYFRVFMKTQAEYLSINGGDYLLNFEIIAISRFFVCFLKISYGGNFEILDYTEIWAIMPDDWEYGVYQKSLFETLFEIIILSIFRLYFKL